MDFGLKTADIHEGIVATGYCMMTLCIMLTPGESVWIILRQSTAQFLDADLDRITSKIEQICCPNAHPVQLQKFFLSNNWLSNSADRKMNQKNEIY